MATKDMRLIKIVVVHTHTNKNLLFILQKPCEIMIKMNKIRLIVFWDIGHFHTSGIQF